MSQALVAALGPVKIFKRVVYSTRTDLDKFLGRSTS